jgi:GNAT superfamily N-acetyltransferase
MHFRQAVLADIAAMSAIRLGVVENRLRDPGRITEAMYRDYLERLGRGWVCEVDGAIAGFAYADTAGASIWALFVDPLYEGRGIGKQLLALAVHFLFDLGKDKIVLTTGADTRADVFYASQGWERGKMKDDIEVQFWLDRPHQTVQEQANENPA